MPKKYPTGFAFGMVEKIFWRGQELMVCGQELMEEA
jgi:hypothetical protein